MLQYVSKSKSLKVVVGILGTIILGAIGSGVWEAALKPMFASTQIAALNLLSLGIKSIKDSTYAQIAKGFHDSSSAASLELLSYFMVLLIGIVAWRAYLLYAKLKLERSELSEKIDELISEVEETKSDNKEQMNKEQLSQSLNDIKRRNSNRSFNQMYWTMILIIIETFIVLSMIWFNLVTIDYQTKAITHFQQVLAIDSPFIADKDRLMFISKFAQIKNSGDYTALIEQLDDIATQNGQDVPSFTIW